MSYINICGQRRSQFEHDHGRRASRLVEHTLTDVCMLPEYPMHIRV